MSGNVLRLPTELNILLKVDYFYRPRITSMHLPEWSPEVTHALRVFYFNNLF